MNLEELKEKVDLVFNREKNPKDIEVCITLNEPSIGGRAKSGVQFVMKGFDWEDNQFRIEPSEKLVRKNRDLQTVIPIREISSFDKTSKVYHCPMCDGKLNKNDYFCRYCGQKLKER